VEKKSALPFICSLPAVGAIYVAAESAGGAPRYCSIRFGGWWIGSSGDLSPRCPVFLDAIAVGRSSDPSGCRCGNCFGCRWIGESVSTLVPSATVARCRFRARLAALHGAPIPTARRAFFVDITLGVFVQIVFTAVGAGLDCCRNRRRDLVRRR